MRSYFCGWYFRCQSDRQTLAIIPSIHKTNDSRFCTLQLITDTQAFHVKFPFTAFQKTRDHIRVGDNLFAKDGITLDIQRPELQASGCVRFRGFTSIRYEIMGPFRYVPFMQCRHSVYSMRHLVDGVLSVNGVSYPFQNAIGYIEGDRGHSFPNEYVWTQCSFPEGALMLSIADIPFGGFHFTGIIGVIRRLFLMQSIRHANPPCASIFVLSSIPRSSSFFTAIGPTFIPSPFPAFAGITISNEPSP